MSGVHWPASLDRLVRSRPMKIQKRWQHLRMTPKVVYHALPQTQGEKGGGGAGGGAAAAMEGEEGPAVKTNISQPPLGMTLGSYIY